MSVGCLEFSVGCLELSAGCLDLSVGCWNLSAGCLDLSFGCLDLSFGWFHASHYLALCVILGPCAGDSPSPSYSWTKPAEVAKPVDDVKPVSQSWEKASSYSSYRASISDVRCQRCCFKLHSQFILAASAVSLVCQSRLSL